MKTPIKGVNLGVHRTPTESIPTSVNRHRLVSETKQNQEARNLMLTRVGRYLRSRLTLYKGQGQNLNCLVDLSTPMRIKVTVLANHAQGWARDQPVPIQIDNNALYTRQKFWMTAVYDPATERFSLTRVLNFKTTYPVADHLKLFQAEFTWPIGGYTKERIKALFRRRIIVPNKPKP